MPGSLGSLKLILSADGRNLEKGLSQVQEKFNQTTQKIITGGKTLPTAFDKLQGALSDTERKLTAGSKTAQRSFDLMGAALAGAVGGFVSQAIAEVASQLSKMAQEAIHSADAYNLLQSRLRQATKGTGDYANVSQELSRIAKLTGSTLEDNVDVFQRLATGAKDLGKSNDEVLRLVQTVGELGVMSGASGSALQAGLLQFGQAMSAGVVRAEEFNSILENLPALANSIAEGLGVSVGQLRQMVLQGKVLSRDVFESLLKQSGKIDSDFAQMATTVERSWNKLEISTQEAFANFDKGAHLTETLASAIEHLASALDNLHLNFQQVGEDLRIFLDRNLTSLEVGRMLHRRLQEKAQQEYLAEAYSNPNLLRIGITSGQDKPYVEPPLNADAEKYKKELEAQIEASQKIREAFRLSGPDEAARVQARMEAEKNIRGQNFAGSLTEKQKQLFVDLEIRKWNKDLLLDAQRYFHEILNATHKAKELAAQVGASPDERVASQRAQFIKDRLEGAPKGLSDTSRASLTTAADAEFDANYRKNLADLLKPGQMQLELSEKLLEAQKLGSVEYQRQKELLEAINAAKEQGKNLTQKDLDKLTAQKTKLVENERQRVFLENQQTLTLSIEQTRLLTDATLQGAKAYQDMQASISAENAVRQAGVEIKTKEGQTLYKLNMELEKQKNLQALLAQVLQDAKTPFENWNVQFQSAIAQYEELLKAGYLTDEEFSRLGKKTRQAFDEVYLQGNFAFQQLDGVITRFGQSVEDTFVEMFQTGSFNFKKLADSVISDVIRMGIQMAMLPMFGSGQNGQMKGFLTSFIQGIFAPRTVPQSASAASSSSILYAQGPLLPSRPLQLGGAFASGGIPPVGIPSLVGERGPELFIPRTPGTILNNRATRLALVGGSDTPMNITHQFVIQANDTRGFAQLLKENEGWFRRIAVESVQAAYNKRGQYGPLDRR